MNQNFSVVTPIAQTNLLNQKAIDTKKGLPVSKLFYTSLIVVTSSLLVANPFKYFLPSVNALPLAEIGKRELINQGVKVLEEIIPERVVNIEDDSVTNVYSCNSGVEVRIPELSEGASHSRENQRILDANRELAEVCQLMSTYSSKEAEILAMPDSPQKQLLLESHRKQLDLILKKQIMAANMLKPGYHESTKNTQYQLVLLEGRLLLRESIGPITLENLDEAVQKLIPPSQRNRYDRVSINVSTVEDNQDEPATNQITVEEEIIPNNNQSDEESLRQLTITIATIKQKPISNPVADSIPSDPETNLSTQIEKIENDPIPLEFNIYDEL